MKTINMTGQQMFETQTTLEEVEAKLQTVRARMLFWKVENENVATDLKRKLQDIITQATLAIENLED